jgi:hypothetical protein
LQKNSFCGKTAEEEMRLVHSLHFVAPHLPWPISQEFPTFSRQNRTSAAQLSEFFLFSLDNALEGGYVVQMKAAVPRLRSGRSRFRRRLRFFLNIAVKMFDMLPVAIYDERTWGENSSEAVCV